MKKRPKTSTLQRKLDKSFSLMVRTRDADEPCISCGIHKPEYEAGHFIKRQKLPTRWHPWNVHAQCIFCNNFNESLTVGFRYGNAIENKYGPLAVEQLERLSVINWKVLPDQLERLILACDSPENYESEWFAVQREFTNG